MSDRPTWDEIASRSAQMEDDLSHSGEEIIEQVKALLADVAAAGAYTWDPADRRVLGNIRRVWASRLRLLTGRLYLAPMVESFRDKPPGKLNKVEPETFFETLRRDRRSSYFRVKEAEFGEAALSRLDARNGRFERCSFDGVSLKGSQLTGTAFVNCTFVDAVFEKSNFELADFVKCDFEHAHFKDACNFRLARFRSTRKADSVALERTAFDDCLIRETQFRGLRADGVTFTRCDLREAGFAEARGGVEFNDCDLSEATFKDADMRKMTLKDVKTRETDFTNARGYGTAGDGEVAVEDADNVRQLPVRSRATG